MTTRISVKTDAASFLMTLIAVILITMVALTLGCSPKEDRAVARMDDVVAKHDEEDIIQEKVVGKDARPVIDSVDSILSSIKESLRVQVEKSTQIADSVWGEFAFGHSMQSRKEYYAEMIHLERKARNYADSVIPDYIKHQSENWDLFISKKEEWVSKLRRTYGFTKAQTDSISIEAMFRNWPLPEVSPDIRP